MLLKIVTVPVTVTVPRSFFNSVTGNGDGNGNEKDFFRRMSLNEKVIKKLLSSILFFLDFMIQATIYGVSRSKTLPDVVEPNPL